jgi:hypothetical protein
VASSGSVDVTVTPEEYAFVQFDASRIRAVVSKLAGEVGLAGPITIEVDETTPLGRAWIVSVEPLVVHVESGAFEDPKRPRLQSDHRVADVLGRLFFRAADRLSPDFADAPADDKLTLQQSTAWDTYSVGRFVRLGYPAQKQRRLYHFRNRHGFSDIADEEFERLWNADGLSWADIQAVCDRTAPTQTPVG